MNNAVGNEVLERKGNLATNLIIKLSLNKNVLSTKKKMEETNIRNKSLVKL